MGTWVLKTGGKYFHHKNVGKSLLLIWRLENKIKYSIQYVYPFCIRDDINTTFIFKFRFGVIIFFCMQQKDIFKYINVPNYIPSPPAKSALYLCITKWYLKELVAPKWYLKELEKKVN